MVHGIARQHGGWIECHSPPEGGARFDLFLPVALDPAAPRVRPTPAARVEAFGAGRVVLLADDEPTIRDLARLTLERVGFRVVEAEDGREAVAAFARESPGVALVVLDLVMPGADGREAFAAIRDLDPAARVLFSSGYSEGGLADLPDAEGVLTKPWRPEQLVEAVRAALSPAPEPANPQAFTETAALTAAGREARF